MESAGRANKCWALFAIVIAVCSLCVGQPAFAGSIVGWGSNDYGETTPPDGDDFVAIAAGAGNSLALKSEGSIVGWGENRKGEATPPDGNDFVAIAAGYNNGLAIRRSCEYVLAGDLNDDCKVDFSDFEILAAHWLIDCNLNPENPACVPK
ncbi:MAG: hypothetical protein A2168_09305 [Planctomycetes bacterium RBG_13_50_24]|nr:MAG: hypothetical protein A2168_09305 [Planctomycetes bacterium RBG_13_50_24]